MKTISANIGAIILLFGGILTISGNNTGDYLIILGTLLALPYILKD